MIQSNQTRRFGLRGFRGAARWAGFRPLSPLAKLDSLGNFGDGTPTRWLDWNLLRSCWTAPSLFQVYPLLYGALEGYKVATNIKNFHSESLKGWASVQIRALHEVYISAVRAGYGDAAVRHLCYLLQAFLEDMDGGMIHQLCTELMDLCRNEDGRFIHPAHTHIQIPGSIVLPPVPMSKFPKVLYVL